MHRLFNDGAPKFSAPHCFCVYMFISIHMYTYTNVFLCLRVYILYVCMIAEKLFPDLPRVYDLAADSPPDKPKA